VSHTQMGLVLGGMRSGVALTSHVAHRDKIMSHIEFSRVAHTDGLVLRGMRSGVALTSRIALVMA